MNGFLLVLVLTIQQGFIEKEIEVPLMRFLDVQDCINAAIVLQEEKYIIRGDLLCDPVVFKDQYANLEE